MPSHGNPVHGTAHVLAALPEEYRETFPKGRIDLAYAWLKSARNKDGGWGGGPGIPSTIEETALAVRALAVSRRPDLAESALEGAAWLCRALGDRKQLPVPIGLYFASLWYYEDLYPLAWGLAALNSTLSILRHQ